MMRSIIYLALIFVTAVQSEDLHDESDHSFFTLDRLKEFDGSDDSKPLYFSVMGDVYDVSSSKSFYGKGGDYGAFAGKDITRAIAIWTKNQKEIDRGMDLYNLSDRELENLERMIHSFKDKYPIVGVMDYKDKVLDDLTKAINEGHEDL